MVTARTSDGLQLSYDRFGRSDGAPLIMIPGLGADSRNWAMQRMAFGRRYRCFAIDNRGMGPSEKPTKPFSLMRLARDVLDVMDAEEIAQAHIMGASMGGVIAQIIAIVAPDRVSSLVLACTACRHHEWRRELFAHWSQLVRERGMQAMTESELEWLIGPRLRRRFGIWINLLARMLLQTDPEVFVAQIDALLALPDDTRLGLASVTTPALIVTGSQDTLTPVADAEELAEMMPTARLTVVSRAAHGLMVETPTAFNDVVLEFLASVTSEPAS
ncbi:MAG: alpha/beta fold hydrolase [Acidimicrobiia bacterium]